MTVINDNDALNAAARSDLSTFIQKAFRILEGKPYQHNWHVDCIAAHLEAVWRGEIRNLIINMPPRMLKTIITSVAFPAWGLGKDPSTEFMLTSYKSSLAKTMTRKSRIILESSWYKDVFPNTIISKDQNEKKHFSTTKGGQYLSSAMYSVTGEGCDIQILDDPLAPKEAVSDTIRENTKETIRDTLFTRFNDPNTGRFVLVMQRLHDDDPTGDLLQDMGWTHLKLPAEAIDKSYHIILGNKEWHLEKSGLLFPERFGRDVLDRKRIELGEYNYAGQYLQEPVPIGGGEFKSTWVQYYDVTTINPKSMNVYILCDPAGGKTKTEKSDWTAFMVVGLAPDNNYYLLDVIRDKLNPTERIDTLFQLHRHWNAKMGKPPKVGYEEYGLAADLHYIEKKKKAENYRFVVKSLGGSMNKEDRIRRMIPDLQNGRWYFPTHLFYVDCYDKRFDLIHELVDCEMKTFPRSKFDDMLDALTRVYDDDLETNFPTLKISQPQSQGSYESESWEDF